MQWQVYYRYKHSGQRIGRRNVMNGIIEFQSKTVRNTKKLMLLCLTLH